MSCPDPDRLQRSIAELEDGPARRPRKLTTFCPSCRAQGIPRTKFACRSCWYRLPADLRREISSNYRRNPAVHLQAVMDALRWYRDNPLPGATS